MKNVEARADDHGERAERQENSGARAGRDRHSIAVPDPRGYAVPADSHRQPRVLQHSRRDRRRTFPHRHQNRTAPHAQRFRQVRSQKSVLKNTTSNVGFLKETKSVVYSILAFSCNATPSESLVFVILNHFLILKTLLYVLFSHQMTEKTLKFLHILLVRKSFPISGTFTSSTVRFTRN